MCIFGNGNKQDSAAEAAQAKKEQPAPPPAPPIAPPEIPAIGNARRAENRKRYGADNPSYRVERPEGQVKTNPDLPIRM